MSSSRILLLRDGLKSELLKRSLVSFAREAIPDYRPGWVHEVVCRKLEQFSDDVAAGRSPRLAIFMPPRHGKSVLSSICMPARHLALHPEHSVMVVSYAAHLAVDFSYKTRDILRQQWFQKAFPDCRIADDRGGVATWTTTAGGSYFPLGIDSSITGRGGNVLVVDDLYKNELEARSASHRDMTYDRYRTTLYTRLAPGGGILILQTRWHDDDVPGRLISRSTSEDGDRWDVISFAAVAEKDEPPYRVRGEALHPERFPIETLRSYERELGPIAWASLYQQEPIPEGGEVITRGMLRWYDPRTKEFEIEDRTVISWDLAESKVEHNDRCAGQVWTRSGANVYLRHAVANNFDFHSVCMTIKGMVESWPGSDIVIESRAWGPAAIQWLREKGVPRVFGWDPQRWGSKQQRVSIASAYASAGNVFIPHIEMVPWVKDTLTEWFRFPVAKHDDAVDAMSQALLWLFKFGSAASGGFIGGIPQKLKPKVW